jgi:hypothetical protein
MMLSSTSSSGIGAEFEGADLKDRRLTDRLVHLASTLAHSPSGSFPAVMGDDASLEATYRFLSNERVTPAAILEPHLRCTATRVHTMTKQVVVAHDTTELNYGRFEREGLGRVGRGKAFGVYAHLALAISRDQRAPLGVLALKTWTRTGEPKVHLKHGKNQLNTKNEARRWAETVSAVSERLGQAGLVIHVMDREADDYALFAHLIDLHERFVVRQYRARTLEHAGERCDVRTVLDDVAFDVERVAKVSARRPSDMPAYRARHPTREVRTAKLSLRAMQITLPRPVTASLRPERSLTLNLVHVLERDPPASCEPIEWWLWTTDPIDTPEQILAIIDAYRARWVIEEFNKALKTGCSIEARQLETKEALLNALAVFTPIAWQLLALRTAARQDPSPPAAAILSKPVLACLAAAYFKRTKHRLPESPSAQQALAAIARIGGHLLHNGPPGWIILHRGFRKLLHLAEGYLIALAELQDVMNP